MSAHVSSIREHWRGRPKLRVDRRLGRWHAPTRIAPVGEFCCKYTEIQVNLFVGRMGSLLASALGFVLVSCAGPHSNNSEVHLTPEEPMSIGAPDIFVHSSGLTVIHQEVTTAPVVAMQYWVRVGSGDESAAEAGLAHVHEHMLFKGTTRRGVGRIAGDIEAIGGSINAWTSFDQTVYHIVVPARFASDGLDVLTDAVTHSVFDEQELTRELEVIQEEIRRGEDMPGRVLMQQVFSTAFQAHPYGRPVIGTSASVASFTRADILRFYERWYRPDNMTLVVAGDLSRDALTSLLDSAFPERAGETTDRPARPQEPAQTAFRSTSLVRDVQEASFSLAFHVPGLSHEDAPALEFLSTLLGSGESSILFERIQRRRRLTDSIYASLYSPAEPGLLFVGGSFRARSRSSVEGLLEAVVREIAELHYAPFPQRELDRVRTVLESSVIYSRETVQGIAQRLGFFHTVAGSLEFEVRFRELSRQVTPATIQDVARRYLTPENLTAGLLLPLNLSEEMPAHDELLELVTRVFEQVRAEHDTQAAVPDVHGLVRREFPNGLVLIVQQDASAQSFAIRAAVLGGSLAESDTTAGSNSLIAELLLGGTGSRSAADIARELDELAASMSGVNGRNSIGLRMTGLSRDFEACIELFSDALFNSSMPEDELERVRGELLNMIAAQRDNLSASAFEQFQATLWAGHPYARRSADAVASVEAMDRSQLLSIYRSLIRPERMVVSVVGNVDPDRVYNTLIAAFPDDVTGRSATLPTRDVPAPITAPIRLEDMRDRQQAHIVVGYATVSMFDDQHHAFDLLAAILSGQSGRLFLELRDRQSLAYSVGAYATTGFEVGCFSFYIATSPAKVEQAIEGIRNEVVRLRDEGVTDEELTRARRLLLGRRDIGLQRPGARAGIFAFDELYGFGHAALYDYEDDLNAVSVDDIHAVIQQYLDPEREVVSIIQPSTGQVPAEERPE